MGCCIRHIGTATSRQSLTQGEFLDRLPIVYGDPRRLRWMRRAARLTGVERRYLAALDFQSDDPDETPRNAGAGRAPGAGSLYRARSEQPHGPGFTERSQAFDRAADALAGAALARLPREELRAAATLITVSCTHASSPGLERVAFVHAPLPAAVARWNLGFMGCSAGLAALRLAAQLRSEAPALIVACELSSLHFQYEGGPDQVTANLLFADGAAAVLTGPDGPVRVRDARCVTLPEHADQMRWFAENHGLRLGLSPELPRTLGAALPELVDGWLDTRGCRRADVGHWLVHPGGPEILNQVEAALELEAGALALSRAVLRDYGNMSSATIYFILAALLQSRPTGLLAAIAFGPGLTVEMALLEIP